jgi:hypothetical protein
MEKNWWVTAFLFSGRPDPQWQLKKKQADHFISLWSQAPVSNKEATIPSILGYKGIKILAEKKQWLIYNGVITCYEEKIKTSKTDDEKTIEKFLLSTAPEEVLKLLRKVNIG